MPGPFRAALKRVMNWIFPRYPFQYKLEPVPNLGKNAQPSKTEVTVPDSQTATGSQSSSSHETLFAEVPNLSKVVTVQPGPIFEGSFSDVYRGTYEGETVAVKVLRSVPEAPDMPRKVRRESKVWWGLRHPNILPYLGSIINIPGVHKFGAMVSPWCENGTADIYLTKNPSLSKRVKLLRDVAKALHYLHNRDPTVVHGDLKPANILVDCWHRARLCDFGLARLVNNGTPTGLTTTSAHMGTARYLAYELVTDNGAPTTASDIYAFGCVAYEFFYSKHPYEHVKDSIANFKVLRAIEQGESPASPPTISGDGLAKLWDLLEMCWAKDAQERPTAIAVDEYLERQGKAIAKCSALAAHAS